MTHDELLGFHLSRETHPFWRPRIRQITGSTNEDVAEAAKAGEPEGLVVLAEEQTAGRGRLGRGWVSPKGKGLWFSMLLRPTVPMPKWGLIPLITGVALAEAVEETTTLKTGLKWPNDLLIDDRKCAGILAEAAVPGAVIVGVGLNVWQSEDELPESPTAIKATSLQLSGGVNLDRTALAINFLLRLQKRYADFQVSQVLSGYSEKCWTIGRNVTVTLPGGGVKTGIATGVDSEGRLIVENSPIAAGDVTHVR